MKSLYESILSSTNSGSYTIIKKISEWWEKYYKDKGKFRVEKLGNVFVIIIDDFERQPSQSSVTIKYDAFESMPKELGGIYYTSYKSRGDKGKLKACQIVLFQLPGRIIDFSNWNMSLGEDPLSTLSLHFTIQFCKNCKIKGLPEYGEVFNCYLMHGTGNTLENIKSPKCNISIHEEDMKIESVTKCDLRELIISAKNFKIIADLYPYLKSGGRYIHYDLQKDLDRLFEENKIEKLRYESDNAHDTPYVASNNWQIEQVSKKIRERISNGNWPKYKLSKLK